MRDRIRRVAFLPASHPLHRPGRCFAAVLLMESLRAARSGKIPGYRNGDGS